MSTKPLPPFAVAFTQYVPPNGKRVQVWMGIDEERYRKALKIMEAGYRFTVERLHMGIISLAIEGKNCDVVGQLCHELATPTAVEELIDTFDFESAARADAEDADI